jgi:hypothetical protein
MNCGWQFRRSRRNPNGLTNWGASRIFVDRWNHRRLEGRFYEQDWAGCSLPRKGYGCCCRCGRVVRRAFLIGRRLDEPDWRLEIISDNWLRVRGFHGDASHRRSARRRWNVGNQWLFDWNRLRSHERFCRNAGWCPWRCCWRFWTGDTSASFERQIVERKEYRSGGGGLANGGTPD